MIKKIFVIFLYFLITVYTVEILLYFYIPKEQKILANILPTRVKLAKDKNIKFDTRSKESAFIEESKKNPNLFTSFNYSAAFSTLTLFKEAQKNNELIPFRGPLNKLTLSCAEDLQYKFIRNDKYGFKNPNDIYEKEIKIFIIGDSFAEGLCQNDENDVAGHLRSINLNTANFGVSGTGPLISLAVFSEYASVFKPETVIYMYFEGNDITDLNWEKKNTNLRKYLKPGYNLNYINRYSEIEDFLDKSNLRLAQLIRKKNEEIQEQSNFFIRALQDIMELTLIKSILRNYVSNDDEVFDEELFFSIIDKMNLETQGWDGKFIFLYIPSWSRYFTKFNEDSKLIKHKELIIQELKNRNIQIIDFESFLSKQSNIKNFYPLGWMGHFNSYGYKKIADLINDKTK